MSRQKLSAAVLVMIVGVGLVGCEFGGKNTVATVGGTKITVEDLNARLAAFPPQYQQALQQKENRLKVLDQMIDEEVALEAARRQGFEKNKELEKQIKNTQRQMLLNFFVQEKIDKAINVTDDDLRNYYNANSAQFKEAELRQLSHILVKTQAEAQTILAELKSGKDFATLAKSKSQDATAQNGGQLGWVQRGQLVPAFEQAGFAIGKRGGLSGVVQTQFGFHIIKLDDVRMRPRYEFEQVKEQIRQMVTTEKKKTMTAELLATLKKDIKVKRNDENVK
ncbi:hypothetical protein EBR57_06500 [bacterium]|nr:hypothetical protein [bacterium]